MKTSTLLALAASMVLIFSTGCRHADPKVTRLPDPSASGRMIAGTPRGPDDAGRIAGGETAVPGAVAGGEFSSANLPDDSKLLGRDQDRSTFASQTVYFEFDRANVRPDEASKIDQVAAQFKIKGADYDLLIEGNCDERGTEEYNRALGERRALAIRELLIQSGVDGGHVFTKSFGKDKPADPGHDEAAWSRNRRGEFVLVLPQKITTTQNAQ